MRLLPQLPHPGRRNARLRASSSGTGESQGLILLGGVANIKVTASNASEGPLMTQTTSRFFDEMAKLMTDAAGAAQGFKQDADSFFRSQAEKVLRDLHVVQREEFEAVKAMAAKALEENERLAKRVGELETALAARQVQSPGSI
jgi:BMFP domain-containing protein YqiC